MNNPFPIATKNQLTNLIHLRKRVFAEYDIIFHINDCYNLKALSNVTDKHQLLFQKFNNRVQQLNLMLVDTRFPLHLADIAVETLLNHISYLKEYIESKKDFFVIGIKEDKNYFNYKLKAFIHYLSFTNIASRQTCAGLLNHEKTYYFKNKEGEIEYLVGWDLNVLIKEILSRMKVKIDLKKSKVINQTAYLNLKIFVD